MRIFINFNNFGCFEKIKKMKILKKLKTIKRLYSVGTKGVKKIFENESIIFWEITVNPTEKTGIHQHFHDYIYYIIKSSELKITDKDGKFLKNIKTKEGDCFPWVLKDDKLIGQDSELPAIHEAQNSGNEVFKEVLVEFKNNPNKIKRLEEELIIEKNKVKELEEKIKELSKL
jgi:hypothetical protein